MSLVWEPKITGGQPMTVVTFDRYKLVVTNEKPGRWLFGVYDIVAKVHANGHAQTKELAQAKAIEEMVRLGSELWAPIGYELTKKGA